MLPDFILRVAVAGDVRRFAACDVPAYIFFFGHPNAFGGTACYAEASPAQQELYREQYRRWTTRVLTRVILAPAPLTPETANRLGAAREELGIAYLHAVGVEHDAGDRPSPEPLSSPWAGPRPWEAEAIAARTAVPEPNLREKIRQMARATRRPHWEVWSMPISEWAWTWRVALEDDIRRRQDGMPRRRPTSSLLNLIGMADGEAA